MVGDPPENRLSSVPPPPPLPPPPLPKRNSVIFPSPDTEHCLVYNKDSPKNLQILMPSQIGEKDCSSSATLDSRKSFSIKEIKLERRSSLPTGLITHELHVARQTPHSESDSLILESTAYVKDIRERRNAAHATLLRANSSNPGDRLRRMLGYRLEQRLVKVLSSRKSRSNTRKGTKKRKKNRHFTPPTEKRNPGLLRKISQKFGQKKSKKTIAKYTSEYNEDFHEEDVLPSDWDQFSRSPTPRFIVDREGTFHWPPKNMKLGNTNDEEDEVEFENKVNSQPDLDSLDEPTSLSEDNFTLKNPSDIPCVLGWLQVKRDSHVFTPALTQHEDDASAISNEKGPFRKAPFHANMHVLTTKI